MDHEALARLLDDELTGWPVDHAAAAVVTPDGQVVLHGPTDRVLALASLSKPMAAWATLVAVEEGIVDLDDAVGPPECTLRHLLAHAGGLPFEGDAPVEPVGRVRIYSNTGYDLIAEHVATAADIPFATYLDEAVLAPLGMADSRLEGSAAHGVRSTCADVARFVGELLAPRLVAPATAAEACSVQFAELDGVVPGIGRFSPCPWGLGPEIAGHKHPHWSGSVRSPRSVGHFGGAGTMMLADPDAGVGVVALTDRPFGEWAAEAVRAWSSLLDAVLSLAPDAGTTGP